MHLKKNKAPRLKCMRTLDKMFALQMKVRKSARNPKVHIATQEENMKI